MRRKVFGTSPPVARSTLRLCSPGKSTRKPLREMAKGSSKTYPTFIRDDVRPKWLPLSPDPPSRSRSEEHTSELQSQSNLVCRLLLEKKKKKQLLDHACTSHNNDDH